MELTRLSALELGRRIQNREISAVEATEACLRKIEEKEKTYHAFLTVERERALSRARQIQAQIQAGEQTGPLAGVPAAIKDNLCLSGVKTTCGSRMLEHFVPPYTATAVERLLAAGAVILGKTNMDEFGMGSTTETSAFGVTRNPYDPDRVPGGSSGGSCAAVALEECFYALGSDTGGSVRQPSSHCGVVGLKPTYGTVSRYGLVAYASSLDQIGPIGKTVADCAAVLEVMAGYDEKDSTSWKREELCLTEGLGQGVKGLRIGIPKDYLGEGLNPEVKAAVLQAASVLEQEGALVEEFELGLVPYAIPAYYLIASAEASSNLARFDGVKYGFRQSTAEGLHEMYKQTRSEGFGAEVKRRILLGSFVLSAGYYDAYYLKALKTKALIKGAFDQAFSRYDLILGPVAPATAPRLGESLSDPLKMYLSDSYTVAANLAGLPAISVPCGADQKGLPMGFQLIADCFREKTLLQAAYAYEQAAGTGAQLCGPAGMQPGAPDNPGRRRAYETV